MVKYQPKTIEEHQVRYEAAVAALVDIESVALGSAANPAESDRCHFHFHDGLRLVITHDCLPRGTRGLHVSASIEADSELWQKVDADKLSFEQFLVLAQRRFVKISGETRELRFAGLSHGKRIPHWFVSDEPDKFEAELQQAEIK